MDLSRRGTLFDLAKQQKETQEMMSKGKVVSYC